MASSLPGVNGTAHDPYGPGRDIVRGARPVLSVVAPAFNQGSSIQDSLRAIIGRLDGAGLDYELIVVSDGSHDETYRQAAALAGERVRVAHYGRNVGKGYALRVGSGVARGQYVGWIDSDMDLDPAGLAGFLERARARHLDIVVGSKRHPGSVVDYPARRRAYSWLYQQLVRALFGLQVRDTQVGMKLFRREVLETVLPVVLVKRYAFDLEMLAVSHHFGYHAIEEAPIRLEYQFSGSGVNWRAIAHALWDTMAVFYRLRLLRHYDKARAVALRLEGRDGALPTLSVVVAPEADSDRLRDTLAFLDDQLPAGAEVIVATPAPLEVPGRRVRVLPAAGDRTARVAAAARAATGDVVAFLRADARPSATWADAALPLFADPSVGAVVGPMVSEMGGTTRADAAGVLLESRLGLGGARIRHHIGRMRQVDRYPLSSLFIRTSSLRRLLDEDHPVDDDLCARLNSATGESVICSPEVVVTSAPTPLFRPYLRAILDAAVSRGRAFGPDRRPEPRHIAPVLFALFLAAAPAALGARGAAARLWLALFAVYGATVACMGLVAMLLHRRPQVALAAAAGAPLSHAVAGVGVLAGLATKRRRRA